MKHQPCAQKTTPKLEIDGGPRAKRGRASIGKPTYLMKPHKPNQKKRKEKKRKTT